MKTRKRRAAPLPVAGKKAAQSVTQGGNWPLLSKPKLGTLGERSVQLALHLKASIPEKAVLLVGDGRIGQVLLARIRLTYLGEAGGQGWPGRGDKIIKELDGTDQNKAPGGRGVRCSDAADYPVTPQRRTAAR